jgi:hypothetical protein
MSSGSVANIELEPGHIVTVERSLGCTILQNKGASTGDLTLTVQTSDDVVVTSTTRSLAWYAPPEDEGLNGQVIALGGGGLLMLVAVVSLLLLRNRSVEIEENEEDIVETKVMQGPSATITPTAEEPAATLTGPPATVTRGPPLPDTGLPEGWTMAQWEHYGQQWLNQHKQSQD